MKNIFKKPVIKEINLENKFLKDLNLTPEQLDVQAKESLMELMEEVDRLEKLYIFYSVVFLTSIVLSLCSFFFYPLFIFVPITLFIFKKGNRCERDLNPLRHLTSFLIDIDQQLERAKVDPTFKVMI